jgi:hypothetical protein
VHSQCYSCSGTITALAKKFIIGNEVATNDKIIAIMGAGIVGALAYNFSDSFWFSAVEGEVYASSSFFTAIVFWGNPQMGRMLQINLTISDGLS